MRRVGDDLAVVPPDGERAAEQASPQEVDRGQRGAPTDAHGTAGGRVASGPVGGGQVARPIQAIRLVLTFDPPLVGTKCIAEVLVDTLDEGPRVQVVQPVSGLPGDA